MLWHIVGYKFGSLLSYIQTSIKIPPHIQIYQPRRHRGREGTLFSQSMNAVWNSLKQHIRLWQENDFPRKWFVHIGLKWNGLLCQPKAVREYWLSEGILSLHLHVPALKLHSVTYSYGTSIRKKYVEWMNVREREHNTHIRTHYKYSKSHTQTQPCWLKPVLSMLWLVGWRAGLFGRNHILIWSPNESKYTQGMDTGTHTYPTPLFKEGKHNLWNPRTFPDLPEFPATGRKKGDSQWLWWKPGRPLDLRGLALFTLSFAQKTVTNWTYQVTQWLVVGVQSAHQQPIVHQSLWLLMIANKDAIFHGQNQLTDFFTYCILDLCYITLHCKKKKVILQFFPNKFYIFPLYLKLTGKSY